MEELDVVPIKIKNRKATGLDEIPPEVWRMRKFDDLLPRYYIAVYNQNTIEMWTKGGFLSSPMKGNSGITQNYRGIRLTFKSAKIYNTLQLNHIEPEIFKILTKSQNVIRRNQCTTTQILKIR